MAETKTLIYDDKVAGRKVLPLPLELPFTRYLDELVKYASTGETKTTIVKLARGDTIYEVSNNLSAYLASAKEPHVEVLRIAGLAASGEPEGFKLMYALLLAVPPIGVLIEELADFRHVVRIMSRIDAKEKADKELMESEEWFKKKVVLCTISHELPNSDTQQEELWLRWKEGVRLAFLDPDRRWDTAVLERVKIELEALDLRIKMIVTKLNIDVHGESILFLSALREETKWRIQAVEEAKQHAGSSTLIVHRKLGERWDGILEALRATEVGTLIADLFVTQATKTHSYTHCKTGAAILHALTTHPALQSHFRKLDNLSCLSLFIHHAGGQILDVMLPIGSKLKALLNLPGFRLNGRLLTIDLRRIPAAHFVDQDDLPREVDWSEIGKDIGISYKSLALIYIDNDNFLAKLLDNPKAVGKPGVIAAISQRCRSPRILSIISNRRELYTGFANKEVPLNLLLNPARVPLTSLRKFIHVRYIDKMSLSRLANKGSGIRGEVRREVQRYLSSIGR